MTVLDWYNRFSEDKGGECMFTEREKWYKRVIILLAGLCLWICYIFEQALSRYAVYTVVSYNVHEIMSFIPFLLLGVTAVWLCYLVFSVLKKKGNSSDKIFAVFLLLIVILQGSYIYNQTTADGNTAVMTVKDVNEESMEITAEDREGQLITLKSPMLVNNLVEADGKEYLIQYKPDKGDWRRGTLEMIYSFKEE